MLSAAKTALRTIFKRYGRHIIYVPRLELTGFDLAHDLQILIDKPDPLIFDVGANVGQSIDLFQRLFPGGRILAFEPDPDSFHELASKYDSEHIQLFQIALSEEEGKGELHRYEKSVLNSLLQLNRTADNCFASIKSIGSVDVATRTVDSVVNELGIAQLDLLKVDTQGLDYKVLLGARQAFVQRRVRAVLIELNFDPLYRGQAQAETVNQYLNNNGLHLIDYYEKVRRGKRLSWCTALFAN